MMVGLARRPRISAGENRPDVAPELRGNSNELQAKGCHPAGVTGDFDTLPVVSPRKAETQPTATMLPIRPAWQIHIAVKAQRLSRIQK